jgi:spore germination protein YaaH
MTPPQIFPVSPSQHRLQQPRRSLMWLLLVLVIGLVIYFSPGFFTSPPYDLTAPGLVIEGQDLGFGLVHLEDGEILLPVSVLQEHIDPTLFWDAAEQILTVTTADQVVRLASDELTAFINAEPVSLEVPIRIVGDLPYAPLSFLARLYGLDWTFDQTAAVVAVLDKDLAHRECLLERSTSLRAGPSLRQVRFTSLKQGERVIIYGEEGGWLKVQSTGGLVGYIPRSATGPISTVLPDQIVPKSYPRWQPKQGAINLTWEYVHSRTPSFAEIGPLPGVNVIAPTWFNLSSPEGDLASRADAAFVKAAHAEGIAVWALVTNDFDPDLTRAVLSSSNKREKVIRQLLTYAHLLELDGLNIDFENVYLADSHLLVQFLRELTPLAHAEGLTVSVDITVPSTSPNWSLVYDRPAIAEIVDYVALMAYDEHWAASPVAGSVASLPWTEAGILATLESVPAKKLLLGLPFYTRLWEEHTLPGGGAKVTSTAYSMSRARVFLEQNSLEPTFDPSSGQNYVSLSLPGITLRLWLEDHASLQARLGLVKKYQLAGVASWQRGYAEPWVWELLAENLGTRQ